MKKNIILIVFALLLFGGCKKDKDVHVANIVEKNPTVTASVTSVTIREKYGYPSDLKSVTVAYTKNSDYSSASMIPAEIQDDYYDSYYHYYYVKLTNLEPNTKYYYYCIFDTGYGSAEGKQRSFTTQSVSATAVTTSSVSNITQTTATCGGNVTSDGGATVTARGVCWSTSQDPTVSDSHTADGTGTGSFTSSITGLTENTTYYVRAYATNSAGTSYGEQKSFTTHDAIAGHEYVDLGLPSGLLWATCNVGADSPEGYGNYYAWGETEPKSTYNWSTYKWCNGSETTLTKYNTDSNYGTVDNKTIIEPEDDAAHVNWGDGWRMPTRAEMYELINNCTLTWTSQNGVNGRKFTGPNGNSIFLPAAGFCINGNFSNFDLNDGEYWSSSLDADDPSGACYLSFFSSGSVHVYSYVIRSSGHSVRPVCTSQSVSAPAVTTSFVSNTTYTTATCGGNVISDGGAAVTARGVCWSTSQNPTVSDSHTIDGSGNGSFTSSITGLTANTTYYVRAYATNSAGTSYGEQKSFYTDPYNGHEYIDLGLPSGLLWATCNVGADSPEDYGNYYAWGETETKSRYSWSTYKWCNGSYNHLTKYNRDWNLGTIDNKTVLDPEDDAAHANLGGDWRMPTHEEMNELKNNCTWIWTNQGGKNGYCVTGSNGKSIFLPAAGYYDDGSLNDTGSHGYYWSSSLRTDNSLYAYDLHFSSSYVVVSGNNYRRCGFSVRPVCPSQK